MESCGVAESPAAVTARMLCPKTECFSEVKKLWLAGKTVKGFFLKNCEKCDL